MVFHQHIASWNAQVVEDSVPVVFELEAVLWPNVSRLYAIEGLERGFVSNWDQEGMHSVPLLVDDQLSVNSCVVAVDSKIPNPPLGRSYFGGVDDETLSGCVVGGCGEQILDI